MKTVLLISSFVSASSVGAGASRFCLERLGHRVVTLPTVLLGRHPGWGEPGGGAVSTARLKSMWTAIAAQNIRFDAILTGYMARASQVTLAALIIDEIIKDWPHCHIAIDPVMGDHGQLYIPKPAALAIKNKLLPRAHTLLPNIFELSYLRNMDIGCAADMHRAAQSLDCDVLVSSAVFQKRAQKKTRTADTGFGAMLKQDIKDKNEQFWALRHNKFPSAPHGTGDVLAGLYLGHILSGLAPKNAFRRAVSSVFDILQATRSDNLSELPIIACQSALITPNLLPIERFTV